MLKNAYCKKPFSIKRKGETILHPYSSFSSNAVPLISSYFFFEVWSADVVSDGKYVFRLKLGFILIYLSGDENYGKQSQSK